MEPATATALIAGGATLIGGFLGNQQSASNTAAANAQTATIVTGKQIGRAHV